MRRFFAKLGAFFQRRRMKDDLAREVASRSVTNRPQLTSSWKNKRMLCIEQ